MSENSEFAQRIIKMRIKYVLEKSQSQIVDEKKLRNIAAKVKEGESQSALAKDLQKTH